VQSAVAAGVPTIGNLQFVQPGERADRERGLREAGVLTVVASWGELENSLIPEAGSGRSRSKAACWRAPDLQAQMRL
jgi:hypothetical protein